MTVPDSLALEPILGQVTVLAKELRHEFYPHLLAIFNALVSLINPKDTKVTHNML